MGPGTRRSLLLSATRLSELIAEFAIHFVSLTHDQTDRARQYVSGLFGASRANMERMSEFLGEPDSQGLQHFLSNSTWESRPVLDQVAREADSLLGGAEDSSLIIDESGMSKKGNHSVGVARQWCGRQGKVDNCQVGVFAALGRPSAATLIDVELYLPQSWTSAPARCRAAGVPPSAAIGKTKHDLALDLIVRAEANGVRFNFVGMDAFYGGDPTLLTQLDAAGIVFVADVKKHQLLWTGDPGREPQTRGQRVDAWTHLQPQSAWKTVVLRDGSKGELRAEFVTGRVWLYNRKERIVSCWHLLVRREIGSPKEIHYTLINAPETASLERLARMHAQRFWIEHALKEAKQQAGMAELQARSWTAWNHHMALGMMAMLFATRERTLHEAALPLLSARDVQELLAVLLPKKAVTPDDVLDQIDRRHRVRAAATNSAIRRQKAKDLAAAKEAEKPG